LGKFRNKNEDDLSGTLKHINKFYGFPVITNQEKELILNDLTGVRTLDKDTIEVSYSEEPQVQFCRDWEEAATYSEPVNSNVQGSGMGKF